MVVALLAISVSHEFLISSRQVENRLQAQQAQAYLLGAESVARQALLQDLQLSPDMDSRLDVWAQTVELELPLGTLIACMVDLQGRINLNSLATPAIEAYSTEQRRFIRLLQALELEEPLSQSNAMMLANAVFDWVDLDDDQRFPGGAEDLFYYQQSPPGKAANQLFASVSELLVINGMTPEIYRALTPHVTLWGNGLLNINTVDSYLSREVLQGDFVGNELPPPVVMRTLNRVEELTPLSIDAAMQIVNRRIDASGFNNLDVFNQGQLAGVSMEMDGLGLASDYFSLAAELTLVDRRYQMRSVLHRYTDALGIPGVRVVSRQMANNRISMDQFCVN
jgi:general secretion pathway protein K